MQEQCNDPKKAIFQTILKCLCIFISKYFENATIKIIKLCIGGIEATIKPFCWKNIQDPEAPVVSEFLNLLRISEFFGFQWQNLSEILSLFFWGHFG